MLCFAGFQLDLDRAELRGPAGESIRLRAKSFDVLRLLAVNAGRLVTKQELLEAVWPSVHVSEDSLFQCIREIRAALGDEQRELIRVISGRGYLLAAEIETAPAAVPIPPETPAGPPPAIASPAPKARPRRKALAVAVAAGLVAVFVAVAVLVKGFQPGVLHARRLPVIAVAPITVVDAAPGLGETASSVTDLLADSLARIEHVRVVAPRPAAALASPPAPATTADYTLSGELQRSGATWRLQAHLTSVATGEVNWSGSVAVDAEAGDAALQRSRLAAGIGHPLALRINALLNAPPPADNGERPGGRAQVVIEQATALINQTTPERFRAAQSMLEQALGTDPDSVDLQLALATHLTRGIQTVWYDPAEIPATEDRVQSLLQRAQALKPDYIPVLETSCRFFTATNRLSESLVACARTLSFDPFDGAALFNLGITEILQGRFEEALATFKRADEYDTPQASRWTWLLGAGLACALMERYADAVPWLERSLAVTPGTGRTHMVLAGAYEALGRHDEAVATMAKGLQMRPGSNAINTPLSAKNASPLYVAAVERVLRLEIAAGMPAN